MSWVVYRLRWLLLNGGQFWHLSVGRKNTSRRQSGMNTRFVMKNMPAHWTGSGRLNTRAKKFCVWLISKLRPQSGGIILSNWRLIGERLKTKQFLLPFSASAHATRKVMSLWCMDRRKQRKIILISFRSIRCIKGKTNPLTRKTLRKCPMNYQLTLKQ